MSKETKKKYAAIGGLVYSKDGDEHFIPAHRVAELYKVNLQECYFVDFARPETYKALPNNLIILTPKSSGDYNPPNQ